MVESIITDNLARRGLLVRHIYEFNPLRQTRVSSIMSPLVGVESDERVVDVFKLMNQPEHPLSKRKRLIVLKDGSAIGVVDRAILYQAASKADPNITVAQVASKNFLTVRVNEFGFEALRLMAVKNAPFLVVVGEDVKAKGYVSSGDMIKAQRDKISDDTIIEEGMFSRLFR